MLPAKFEAAFPACERPHPFAIDRAVTGFGWLVFVLLSVF
jgi:hypothetical protein